MFPVHPIFVLLFLLICVVLGMVVGCATGGVMTWLLPKSKSKIAVDLALGVLGCLIGAFVSGWASERAFNAGMRRAYFIWDENGRAIDWRTALAEHQGLLAILGAIVCVICWHLMIAVRRKLNSSVSV